MARAGRVPPAPPAALTRTREWTLIALVAAIAALTGVLYSVWKVAPQPAAADAAAVLLRSEIPDLEGRLQAISQWRGKVVVVNFWATWCAPCREEIPVFIRLQDKYGARGLQFVGIAIDQPEKVRPYAAELGMNFPVLIGGAGAVDLSRLLGNRAGVLPFTVILDRDGKIVRTEIGAVKEAVIEPFLASLL